MSKTASGDIAMHTTEGILYRLGSTIYRVNATAIPGPYPP